MDPEQHRKLAYTITLAGGIVLIAGAIIALLVMGTMASLIFGFAPEMGPSEVISALLIPVLLLLLVVVPAICGVVTIQVARDYGRAGRHPDRNGIKALVAGGVAFLGGGGIFLGATLTVAGGILMLMQTGPGPRQEPWGARKP